MVHCFTGGEQELLAYLELDCHIGITGFIADERRAGPLCCAAPQIPLARLMIETDAPFLLPPSAPGRHGRRNEPGLVPVVLDAVARAAGSDRVSLARATTENARRFFRLAVMG